MKTILNLLIIVGISFSAFAQSEEKLEDKLSDVAQVLTEMQELPEQKVPAAILNRAEGIMIIPNVIKGGLVVGGRHGKGIAMVKNDDGEWSNPIFVNITGGSVGWQIGAQSTDVILVFKSSDKLKNFKKSEFTLGADAAVAAGPVGRQVSAATDISFDAEVYSYSRSRGVFAGISLEGSSIKLNENANKTFYGEKLSPENIYFNQELKTGARVSQIKVKLANMENEVK
ncbi:lipid-binding SYLF domain-containing protein [Chondrinema litorale]|uniref:lipid-binding SYLF domain-containing protein n=1 Tax=Chondrinema litorale TaxID=2994555 RepID=UPI0025430057|nr:lipid-binding SYLF domain-containing protein [Chondrinema litorale]UZR93599.1 lipid-binding SYLF domain-containing protein [Chondrinema litorale]